MATLRFDLEEGAKHALRGGRFAIVPGEPANSQMITRDHRHQSRRPDAAESGRCGGRRTTQRPASRAADAMDRAGRDVAEALVVHSAEAA